jgi:uncharacterized membrane protein
MIRDSLKQRMIGMNPDFRYRGVEPGRMENFSDAVFALAITLLLISTSPPTNFDQIKRFVWELIPFTLCITFIILIWHEHFTFFFRYGMRNSKVLVLNSIFLIIVLFYVYPLKFLTKLILLPLAMLFGQETLKAEMVGMIRGEDMADLMIIYGLGAFAVFIILMLMYRYAYKQADELELTELERFDTLAKIKMNKLMAIIPLISVVIAVIFHSYWLVGMFAGFIYFLYTPVMFVFGRRTEKARQALMVSMETKETEA